MDDLEGAEGPTELERGTDVGGYIIEDILGSGGMGVVYAATHPLIGKRAAVKVLRPALSSDVRAVERFITEARSVNQIGHPNIVDIFAFGALPDGRHYYVMDLLVGESLRTRLKRTGALHVSEAAVVIDEITSALVAAHAKGIVHRDLKPDNVFMMSVPGRWPEVKLLDWGLAKLLAPTTKFRTVTGALLGTPVYMSPEQALAADTVDARTDIYSLGVISYELLAGEAPFKRNTSMETLLANAEDVVPPLAPRAPGLPEELVQLIEAMLAKEPEERPTLAAVRTVLRRLKGTKIPTMTAAGIAMELPPTLAEVSYPRPSTDELRTFDDNDARTRPPARGGPPALDARSPPQELRVTRPRLGTPPTVPESPGFAPNGPFADAGQFASPPSLDDAGRFSSPTLPGSRPPRAAATSPRPAPTTAAPALGGVSPPPPTTPPPILSAPAPGADLAVRLGTPAPMTPDDAPLPAGGSQPPAPNAAGSHPPGALPRARTESVGPQPRRSRWPLVLVVVAILGGIGIAVAFLS